MKRCRSCQQVKPVTEFHRHSQRSDGYCGDCKICALKRTRDWNKANADKKGRNSRKWYAENKVRASKNNKNWRRRNPERTRAIRIKSVYGLSADRVSNQLQKQSGCCALCLETSGLGVDHDHITGQFRELLCRAHNTALGHFGDSVVGLSRAIKYLTEHSK